MNPIKMLKVLNDLKKPEVSLSQQVMEVRKEMALLMPKLAVIQNSDILDKETLMDLSIHTMNHAWSLLQLQVSLLQETKLGE